jgi:hypothetical protein
MTISDTNLERFRVIYEEQFGESLTDSELGRKAHLLLNLYLSIYGNPIIEKSNHN